MNIFKVSGTDPWVLKNHTQIAFRYFLTSIHNHNPVSNGVQQFNSMLDYDNGDILFFGQNPDQVIEVVDFRVDQSCGGFVHE